MISFIFKAMFSENAHHLGNFQLNVLIFLGLIELMGRDSCLPLVYCIYLPSLSITELTDFYVSTCVCVCAANSCLQADTDPAVVQVHPTCSWSENVAFGQ